LSRLGKYVLVVDIVGGATALTKVADTVGW